MGSSFRWASIVGPWNAKRIILDHPVRQCPPARGPPVHHGTDPPCDSHSLGHASPDCSHFNHDSVHVVHVYNFMVRVWEKEEEHSKEGLVQLHMCVCVLKHRNVCVIYTYIHTYIYIYIYSHSHSVLAEVILKDIELQDTVKISNRYINYP